MGAPPFVLFKGWATRGNAAPNNSILQNTNQISGLTYDAAGNIQQWNDGTMTHTYTYDAEGLLVSIDSNSVQYTYDALGNRVEKNVGGTKHDYIYDQSGNVVDDVDGTTGGWLRGEIWAGGRHLATYTNGETYFPETDWLGSARVWTDVTGAVAMTCTDQPYGDALSCTGSMGTYPSAYNFAGMEQDPETAFYHTQFRYYNPKLGSWMTPDPAGMAASDLSNPQSLNRYAYVGDNPINEIDPLGLCDPKIDAKHCKGVPPNPDITVNVTDNGDYSDIGGFSPTDWTRKTCMSDWWGATVVMMGDAPRYYPACVDGGGPKTVNIAAPPQTPQRTVAHWYNTCTGQALLKGAGSTAVDAIGIIPEGGTVSAAFSLFHGAAGVSNGTKILGRVAFAGGLISTIGAAHDLQGTQESTLSTTITSLQAATGAFGIAKGLIEDIPVAGQVIAIGATALDVVGTGLEVAKCYRQ